MAEYRFDDSAYVGQTPNRTSPESLAYLGSFDRNVGTGVCIACDDEAYLGLAPGRTTFSRAAYLGLLESSGVVVPVVNSSGGWGYTKRRPSPKADPYQPSRGYHKPLPSIQIVLNPVLSYDQEEEEEELAAMFAFMVDTAVF